MQRQKNAQRASKTTSLQGPNSKIGRECTPISESMNLNHPEEKDK